MSRVFFISNRTCLGPVGGGRGVNYKLFEANKKYKLINDAVFIFKNCILNNESEEPLISSNNTNVKKKSKIMELLSTSGLCCCIRDCILHYEYKKRIKKLDKELQFSSDDVYVFQDIESAFCFNKVIGDMPKATIVYHQQGSMYNEWISFNGKESRVYRFYLYKLMSKTIKAIKSISFPSRGAKECLLDTEPSLDNDLSNAKENIFYNGVKIDDKKRKNDLPDILKPIKDLNKTKFVTVSALNEAKAIQNIPQYLSRIKSDGYDFVWVLVGNGIKAHEVKEEIDKYGISPDVVWIKEPLPHDQIMSLFRITDFYIILQKYSIFDYATLEAMSCGNIPFLSPVCGNLEIITNQNGVFLSELPDVIQVEEIVKSKTTESYKDLNVEIQKAQFSDFTCLKRYADWIKDNQ